MEKYEEFKKDVERRWNIAESHGNDDQVSHLKTLLQCENIEKILSVFKGKEDYSYRRKFLKTMTFLEYKDLLLSLNSCYNDNNGEFDGWDASWGLHNQTPYRFDKEHSLEAVFNLMKKYINDDNLTDIQALLYASIILSDGGLIVHPFIDGNGRTHRFLEYSIMNGCPNFEKIIKLCTHRSGQEMVSVGYFTSMVCQRYFEKYLKEELEKNDVIIDNDNHYSLAEIYYLHLKGEYNSNITLEEYLNSLDDYERSIFEQTMNVIDSRLPSQGFLMLVGSNNNISDVDPLYERYIKLHLNPDKNRSYFEREERLRKYLPSYFGYQISEDDYNSIIYKLPCLDTALLFRARNSEEIPLLDKPLFKQEYIEENEAYTELHEMIEESNEDTVENNIDINKEKN